MSNQIKSMAFFVLCASLCACGGPGVGGHATIHGKVKRQWMHGSTDVLFTDYAENESVYIEYGDHGFYDDNLKTDKDGEYEFPYLYKGKYTIYAYGDCFFSIDSCLDSKESDVITVDVTENGVTEAPDIVIKKIY